MSIHNKNTIAAFTGGALASLLIYSDLEIWKLAIVGMALLPLGIMVVISHSPVKRHASAESNSTQLKKETNEYSP